MISVKHRAGVFKTLSIVANLSAFFKKRLKYEEFALFDAVHSDGESANKGYFLRAITS